MLKPFRIVDTSHAPIINLLNPEQCLVLLNCWTPLNYFEFGSRVHKLVDCFTNKQTSLSTAVTIDNKMGHSDISETVPPVPLPKPSLESLFWLRENFPRIRLFRHAAMVQTGEKKINCHIQTNQEHWECEGSF